MEDDGTPDGVTGVVLRDGAAWGPRFVALRGRPRGPGWVGAEELFGPGLPEAVSRVGDARGTDSPAVAGTLLLDVYAQRVVAPVLAAFVLEGRVLDARMPTVTVEPVESGFRRLAFDGAATGVDDVDRGRALLIEGLVEDHLGTAVHAVHDHTRAGLRVLRGAVANAVAITFLHLSWPDADHARHVETARTFLASTPDLADLVGIEAVEETGRRWMYTDRRACCLAFRTTDNQAREQPYCATCPVVPRATTREMFSRATASYTERHPGL